MFDAILTLAIGLAIPIIGFLLLALYANSRR